MSSRLCLVPLFGFVLAAAACSGPAPRPGSQPPAPVTVGAADATLVDAGVAMTSGDAGRPPATPGDAGSAQGGDAASRSDAPPAAPPGGHVFRKTDGSCWWHQPVTCPANVDCIPPPHRQVACPLP